MDDGLQIWSLYFMRCAAGPLKVGRAKNVAQRLADLQVANPYELTLIDGFACGTMKTACELETFVHRKLSAFHIRGEWFSAEAEPYITRLLELVRNKHRRESIANAIREGDWYAGLEERALKLSKAERIGVQKAKAAHRFRRAAPSEVKRKAHTWLWRGKWRGALPTGGKIDGIESRNRPVDPE